MFSWLAVQRRLALEHGYAGHVGHLLRAFHILLGFYQNVPTLYHHRRYHCDRQDDHLKTNVLYECVIMCVCVVEWGWGGRGTCEFCIKIFSFV